jgi:hypothetical protein
MRSPTAGRAALQGSRPSPRPVPYDYFLRHQKFLRARPVGGAADGGAARADAFLAFAAREKAEVLFRSDTATEREEGPAAGLRAAWNHTTLRGAARRPDHHLSAGALSRFPTTSRASRDPEIFGDEVPGHLEFVRFDGKVTCFGLPIVRFTTEERLDEIIRIHEDNGCPIFNPHRYTLEEGGMKQTDEVQLAFKRRPIRKGLLNPGKMIAWENPDFEFTLENGRTRPCLHNIRKVAAVTTYGGSRLSAWLLGDPPRKLVKRLLRATVHPAASLRYLALYDMNRATQPGRDRFLAQVGDAMDSF